MEFGFDQRIQVRRDPVDHLVIDGLFGGERNRAIFEHVLSLREHFETAVIGPDRRVDEGYRRNLICYPDRLFHCVEADGDWERRVEFRKRSPLLAAVDDLLLSPDLRDVLDSAPFPLCKFREVNRWETHLARYGDEDKYEWHIDRIAEDSRLISIVYYVHAEPKRFTGGELELTDALVRGGKLITEGRVARVEVANDRAIIFGGRTVHRVLPTRCSGEFEAGRFSANIFCGREGAPPTGRTY